MSAYDEESIAIQRNPTDKEEMKIFAGASK